MELNTNKSSWMKWNNDAKKRKLTPSFETTYKLFLKGNDVKQIAKIREVKEETIQIQTIDLIAKALINIDDVVNKDRQEYINSKITNKNISSLKEIKEQVGDDYSYFEIKCILAHLNLEPKRIRK